MKFIVEIPEKDADRMYDDCGDTIAMCDAIAEAIQDARDIKKVIVKTLDFEK